MKESEGEEKRKQNKIFHKTIGYRSKFKHGGKEYEALLVIFTNAINKVAGLFQNPCTLSEV